MKRQVIKDYTFEAGAKRPGILKRPPHKTAVEVFFCGTGTGRIKNLEGFYL